MVFGVWGLVFGGLEFDFFVFGKGFWSFEFWVCNFVVENSDLGFCLRICSLVFGVWNVGVWVIDIVVLGMGFGVWSFGFGIWKLGSLIYGFCHGLCNLVFAVWNL